jgi:tRNA A-37 threonylcarbamoyl transferase component Bud32
MNPGQEIAGFIIKEKLGSGGMATVYLALQRSLDRPVVVKILHPHLAEDAGLVARFEREARAAAHLKHENIVQVIDCGRDGQVSFIAMEFVEGMDLRRLLDLAGAPPVSISILLLRDMARGLEHAHVHGVIHRDIKPANLMLTPNGTLKIMDFGLARLGEDAGGMTATGSVLGTPAYMSPEQAEGRKLDHRTDLFSLGVVGYELLSGHRPFAGDSFPSVIRALTQTEAEPLEGFVPNLPPGLAGLIHGMLQKDPDQRCAGAGLVREELETIAVTLGLHRGQEALREYERNPVEYGARHRGGEAPTALTEATSPPRTISEETVVAPATRVAAATPPSETARPPGLADQVAPAVRAAPVTSPAPVARPRTRLPWLWIAAGLVVVATGMTFLWPRRTPLHPVANPQVAREPVRTPGSPAVSGSGGAVRQPDRTVKPEPDVNTEHQNTPVTPRSEPPASGTARTQDRGEERSGAGAETAPATAPETDVSQASARRFRISSKPSFTWISVDGRGEPANADGMPFTTSLKPGLHTFRAVNKELGIDKVFRYQVEPQDGNNTLILNLQTGQVEPRKNSELPF